MSSIYFTKSSELSNSTRLVMLSNVGGVRLDLVIHNNRYTSAALTKRVSTSMLRTTISLPKNKYFKGISCGDSEVLGSLLLQCESLTNHGLQDCDNDSYSFDFRSIVVG